MNRLFSVTSNLVHVHLKKKKKNLYLYTLNFQWALIYVPNYIKLSAAGDFYGRTPPGTVQVPSPSNQATPQLSSPPESDRMNYAGHDLEVGDATEAIIGEQKDVDLLDKFLPPPPKAKCSEELQVSSFSQQLLYFFVHLLFPSVRFCFFPCVILILICILLTIN